MEEGSTVSEIEMATVALAILFGAAGSPPSSQQRHGGSSIFSSAAAPLLSTPPWRHSGNKQENAHKIPKSCRPHLLRGSGYSMGSKQPVTESQSVSVMRALHICMYM